jgi:hypothetical protein
MTIIAELHSNTNGKPHTVRSDLFFIMNLVMLIGIEMLFALRLAPQRVKSLLKSVLKHK